MISANARYASDSEYATSAIPRIGFARLETQ